MIEKSALYDYGVLSLPRGEEGFPQFWWGFDHGLVRVPFDDSDLLLDVSDAVQNWMTFLKQFRDDTLITDAAWQVLQSQVDLGGKQGVHSTACKSFNACLVLPDFF